MHSLPLPRQFVSAAVILVTGFLLACHAYADEPSPRAWQGFRGDGTNVTSAKRVPVKWSHHEGVAWSVDVPGYGQSSPVVWNDRVFVTSIEGPNKEKCLVHAFDLKDGTKVWTRDFSATQTQKNSAMTSRAAPTSAVDADRLYVFFESGELAGLDHDGNVLWERSLAKEYGTTKSSHGLGSSLAQTDQAVIAMVADSELSYLIAVDKATGNNLWKIDRDKKTSWTSPIVTYRDKKPIVIVSSNGRVEAYGGEDGQHLWMLDGIVGNTIPSVSVSGDYVLIGASVPRQSSDPDDASQSNCCLRLSQEDGKETYEVVWGAKKATTSYATPLAYQGRVYYVNKAGVVYCLDLKTGDQIFAKRIEGPCWASPLGANGYVYFFTKRGPTVVLQADDTFREIETNSLFPDRNDAPSTSNTANGDAQRPAEVTVYGVAAVEGAFVIRTGQRLVCVRTPN